MMTQLEARRAFAAMLKEPVWDGRSTIPAGASVTLVHARSFLVEGEPRTASKLGTLVLKHEFDVWGFDASGQYVHVPLVPENKLNGIFSLACEKSPK